MDQSFHPTQSGLGVRPRGAELQKFITYLKRLDFEDVCLRLCLELWFEPSRFFLMWLTIGEQRRRSRINEKMKALQSLIPNSNKV